MFENTVPLNPDRHRHLRYSANQPYHFAAQEMLIPVVSGEMQMVAREYPIVFPAQSGLPMALMGLDKGQNLHVQRSGHWVGRYIPAYIKAYPFIAAPKKDSDQEYAIMVDPQAPHMTADSGERIFTDEGKPSPVLEKVIKALRTLLQDEMRTKKIVAQLDQAGLLVEQNLRVGQESAITGFRVVDRQALLQLDSEAVPSLNSSGALMLAYAHLLSLTNLQDGLLAQKKKAEPEQPLPEGPFFSDDTMFKFDI